MVYPLDDDAQVPTENDGGDGERQKEENEGVSDRRRFTAEGARRVPDQGNGESEPASAAEPVPEMVPLEELRGWEQRARDAEAKLSELADTYRRARGDLESARARLERDQDVRVRDALGRAFAGILAALDNLDRALSHAEPGPLAEGVDLVRRQLLEAMAAQGLERIEVLGQVFDPALAEAVATTPAESPEQAHHVVEEYRAGYRLGDRVLRPAQVRVAV